MLTNREPSLRGTKQSPIGRANMQIRFV